MFNQDLLFQTLFFCRFSEYKHQCSVFPRTVDWAYYPSEPPSDFWCAGFHFVKGKVFAYNVMIYSDKDWDNPKLLDVTDTFVKLQEYYHPYHIVWIMEMVIKKYYRENVLVENHYLHFKHHNENFTPKKRYGTEKHRERETKYIDRNGHKVQGLWNRILFSAATNELFLNSFQRFQKQRFDSKHYIWHVRDEISRASHERKLSLDLQRCKKTTNK